MTRGVPGEAADNLPQPGRRAFVARPLLLLLLLAFTQCAAASHCKQPLDADTLNQLQLGWHPDVQLQPGQTSQFELSILSTFAPAKKVPACVLWKIQPEGKGASIDQKGLLKIDAKAPAGARFTVIADIEKGRAQRQATVLIYTPQAQPLVGLWEQTQQYDCETGEKLKMFPAIRELEFRASGRFSVTWTPFEVYRDYWGDYSTDPTKNGLSMKIAGGNFVPQDFHGDGFYKVLDEKTIELRNLYLGTKEQANPEAAVQPLGAKCRYIFTLTSRPQ
jgi:hypothetical protein